MHIIIWVEKDFDHYKNRQHTLLNLKKYSKVIFKSKYILYKLGRSIQVKRPFDHKRLGSNV